jgi:molybdate-binding protein
MGKLLFPRGEVEAWIASRQNRSEEPRPAPSTNSRTLPNIVVGSHDPLLEWALTQSLSGLAVYFDGSSDGLRRLAAREGCAAGIHLYDARSGDWNTPGTLGACAALPIAVLEWARRRRGLIVSPSCASKVIGLGDLAGLRFAARQPGAGAQVLFDHVRDEAGLAPEALTVTATARNEADAALAVVEDRADACFGLEALAAQYRLAFVPLAEERFDLAVDRRAYFEPPLQDLMRFCRSDEFRKRAAALPGYDVAGLGTVHFNGP